MMVTLPRRLWTSDRCGHQSPEFAILFNDQYPHCQQACWSKYLSSFNLVICFCPGKLRTKPDTLTRRWDIYLKEVNSDYASVNPQNYCPVFTSEQLASSLKATTLSIPVLHGSLITESGLHDGKPSNICSP